MADDLADSAIDARMRQEQRNAQRQQIDQRAQQIARQLSTIPGGRRNRGQMESLRAELANLHDARTNLNAQDRIDQQNTQLRTHTTLQNARMEHQASRDALSDKTAQEAAAVYSGVTRLASQYAPHDPRLAQGMEDLRQKYPYGFAAESTKGHLLPLTKFIDNETNRNRTNLSQALFKQTQLSPEQFLSGLATARAADIPLRVPVDPNDAKKGTRPPLLAEIEKARKENGQTVAMEINGVTKLFDRGFFDNLKATFGNQPAPQAITVADTQPTVQPVVPTYGGQGAAPPSALVRNPDGSISPIVPVHTGEGAAAPGSVVNTGGYSFQATGTPADQAAQVAGFRDAAQANAWRSGQPLTAPSESINPPPIHMENGPTASGGYASRVRPSNTGNVSSTSPPASPGDILNQPPSVPLIGAQSSQVASVPQPEISGQPARLPTPTATPIASVAPQIAAQPTPPAIPAVQQPQATAQPSATQTPSTVPQASGVRYLNGVAHTFNTETKQWEPQQ